MNTPQKSILWSAVERFSVQGIQFLLTLVIARYLTPADYGLVAMLSIFMAVAQTFIDSGFGAALIQKQDRNEVDYSTVFYFNIAISVALYLTLYLVSPWISEFYHEPQLKLLTRVIGLNLIISAFSLIQFTILNVKYDFKTLSKASLTAVCISGILGITMAVRGFGVWTLVCQTLLNNILNVSILWIITKWRPRLVFSIISFNRLFGFGSKLLCSSLLHAIYLNMYSLVVGRFYNATDVGLYNRASSISQYTTTNIMSILNRVYYPLLCERQNKDKEFEELFYKYLRLACFIVVPLSFGMASVSEPLIEVVLSHNWAGAIYPLKILSWSYALYPWLLVCNQPLRAKGRSDLFLRAEIVKKIAAVIILLIAVNFGLIALCYSVMIYNIVDTIIIVSYVKKVMKTSFVLQLKNVASIFISGVLMECVVELSINLLPMPYIAQLFISILIGSIMFMLTSMLLRQPEFFSMIETLKKKMK